jgi:hypothetical protein
VFCVAVPAWLNFYRQATDAPSHMFSLFKRRPSAEHLAQKIRWVAEAIGQSDDFVERAKQVASELGPGSIPRLAKQFHAEHSPPPELAAQFRGLGQWIAARQRAIFEIFYFCRERAIPVLRRVAFGKYDWTQGNAIEVLCRLAAEGINTDSTVSEIRAALPKMRTEALLYGFGPLLHRAAHDAKLEQLLNRFADIPEYNGAVDELKNA